MAIYPTNQPPYPIPPSTAPFGWGVPGYRPPYPTSNPNPKQLADATTQANPAYSAPLFKVRPVSNMEEAKAAPIEFDGSIHIFVDIPGSKIYTKALLQNGAVRFDTYSLDPEPVPPAILSEEDREKRWTLVVNESNERWHSQIEELKESLKNLAGRFEDLNARMGVAISAGRIEPNAIGKSSSKQRKSDANDSDDGR